MVKERRLYDYERPELPSSGEKPEAILPVDKEYWREHVFKYCLSSVVSSVPHRVILIGDDVRTGPARLSMSFNDSTKEIHIYQATEDAALTLCYLEIFSISNAPPHGGGHMEGYTFRKCMQVPKEDYYLSDEELVEKYEDCFH